MIDYAYAELKFQITLSLNTLNLKLENTASAKLKQTSDNIRHTAKGS